MKNKKLALVVLTAGLSVLSCIPAFAGQWKQDSKGWWYQEDNSSYPVSTWKEINGKQYYFGADGYMLANTTTPDGYTVNGDGAWTVNGVVQERKTVSENAVAKAMVEDMGLTYAELKAKYGDYEQGREEKNQNYQFNFSKNIYYDDKYSTMETTDSSWDDFFKESYPYYGKQVAFSNSPIKIAYKDDSPEKYWGALWYPNYILEADSSWNILSDKKPVFIQTEVKNLFPDLPEHFELDVLQKKIESCGATNLEVSDDESSYKNPFAANAMVQSRTVKITFLLGGYRCELSNYSMSFDENQRCPQPILLDTRIYIYRK